MSRPHPTAPVLATVALLGGVLQVMATVQLGLAPLEKLRLAAAEGATLYLAGTLGVVAGLFAAWMLRRRPLWAVLMLLGWQGAVLWPLHARTSKLGLAFHGEYVLHHFTGLVAAATVVAIVTGWLRNRALGRARVLPVALVLPGVLALLAAHIVEQPGLDLPRMPWLERTGAGLMLLGWASAVGALWPQLGPSRLRGIALVLLVPFVVRVVFSWPDGLSGASVSEDGRMILMAAMILAAAGTFALFRPPLPNGLRVMVLAFCGFATITLYYFYRHGFGDLEAGLGGLAQSVFAFSLPYPTYVSAWQVWLVMAGLFCMFAAAYSGLVSPGHRVRGIALALLGIAGLGLSTPPLALMTGAAALLWIDTLVGHGEAAQPWRPPAEPFDELLTAVTEAQPTLSLLDLSEGRERVFALRGDIEDVAVDVRARSRSDDRWKLHIRIGVLGRGRAPLRLLPEAHGDGPRPGHAIGNTHALHGDVRQIELIDDDVLDTLLPLPGAQIDFWSAGTRIVAGPDLSRLDAERLAELLHRLATRP